MNVSLDLRSEVPLGLAQNYCSILLIWRSSFVDVKRKSTFNWNNFFLRFRKPSKRYERRISQSGEKSMLSSFDPRNDSVRKQEVEQMIICHWISVRSYMWISILCLDICSVQMLFKNFVWRRQVIAEAIQRHGCHSYEKKINFPFKPLHPNISMHILHTVLLTSPKIPTRRIRMSIKRFFR